MNNNMSILLGNNRTGYNEGVWGILGFFPSPLQRLFIFLKLVPFPLSYTSFPQIPSGGGEASFKVVGQLRTRTTSTSYNMSGHIVPLFTSFVSDTTNYKVPNAITYPQSIINKNSYLFTPRHHKWGAL